MKTPLQSALEKLNDLGGTVTTSEPTAAELLPIIKELLFRIHNLENHVLPPEGGLDGRQRQRP